jgi:hypothetical protein
MRIAERLTEDAPAWHAGATRARAEARATLEQAEELRRVLEELRERMSDRNRYKIHREFIGVGTLQ